MAGLTPVQRSKFNQTKNRLHERPSQTILKLDIKNFPNDVLHNERKQNYLKNDIQNLKTKPQDINTKDSDESVKSENMRRAKKSKTSKTHSRYSDSDLNNLKRTYSSKISSKSSTSTISSTKNNPAEPFIHSLYLTKCSSAVDKKNHKHITRDEFYVFMKKIKLTGEYKLTDTKYGLIASFTAESDAEHVLNQLNQTEDLGKTLHVSRFPANTLPCKQTVILQNIPSAIPIEDICSALKRQNILYGKVDRRQQNIYVEIFDPGKIKNLTTHGFNFFDVTRFKVNADRSKLNESNCQLQKRSQQTEQDQVLQCYRCQGFWHIAANCHHMPRCVRCGEPHSVELCPKQRNDPLCCLCSGPHHAAYRYCPVRMQLQNSFPVSLTLSRQVRHNNTTKF